jgi:hypothetical protein
MNPTRRVPMSSNGISITDLGGLDAIRDHPVVVSPEGLFKTMVGKRLLTSNLYERLEVMVNGEITNSELRKTSRKFKIPMLVVNWRTGLVIDVIFRGFNGTTGDVKFTIHSLPPFLEKLLADGTDLAHVTAEDHEYRFFSRLKDRLDDGRNIEAEFIHDNDVSVLYGSAAEEIKVSGEMKAMEKLLESYVGSLILRRKYREVSRIRIPRWVQGRDNAMAAEADVLETVTREQQETR